MVSPGDRQRNQCKNILCPLRGGCSLASVFAIMMLLSLPVLATVYGSVRGVVHDPQHHPVGGATVVLQASDSAFKMESKTNADGEFSFSAVPFGKYSVTVQGDRFRRAIAGLHRSLGTSAGAALSAGTGQQGRERHGYGRARGPESRLSAPRPYHLPEADLRLRRRQLQSNSFKMITDFVPGSYMVHDQLHVRGGHQVTWAIDGVPIPNTNIASTVGPQFNPRDVSYMQAETGSYGAEYGDRTYGVFNVAPNTGFERNREAEFIGGYGNFNQTDDWLSFGDHTEKFAYYVSGSGNSTEYGLEPPTPVNLHNAAQGGGAFTSLLYNPELRRPAALHRGLAPGLLPGAERSRPAGRGH